MYYMQINKNFEHQVGDQPSLKKSTLGRYIIPRFSVQQGGLLSVQRRYFVLL